MTWPVKSLGEVLQISRGGSPRPIENYLTDDEDGLNWIKIGDVAIGEKYITSTKEKILKSGLSKTRQVHAGDFLLSNSMSFGRPYITKVSGCIHDGWLMLRDEKKVFDQDFLYHLLSSNSVQAQFRKYASGAVVKNLNIDAVSKVCVAIPPLAEQQRIAALLDTADNLLRLREAAIDKLDQLANVAYEDLLQSSKVVIEELASDLFVFIRNGLNVKQSSETDGLPITRIETISHSNINLKKVGYAGLDAADCGNFILHDGDILFSHINSVAHLGKCALYDQGMGPLVHGMNLLCFRPNIKKLTPHFALFSIRSQFFRRQMAKSIKKAVNQASLSTGDLKKISLRVPSLEDQRKFSDFVLNIELRKRNMFQSKENLQTLIASMQQQEFSVN